MGVLLEINAGPFAGKKIAVVTGKTVTFGRAAAKAEFALPHDTFMSGMHFAVECGPTGCRVQDRKSSNGTFLNGARIQDAMLANGDEIKSGQTIFAVKVVPDAKLAAFLPVEDSALPPAPERLPRAAEPAPPSAPERSPSAPEPRPRAVEPLPPSTPEQRPRAAEPVAPVIPERRPPEPVAPSVEAANEAQRFQPPAAEVSPAAPPPVPEPPKFRAIPTPPVTPPAGSAPLRPASSPPNAAAKPPRGPEQPPPGVAPFIAEKFAERPGAADAGKARGFAFSVMGWSFPVAPVEWQVQEGFGLQQAGAAAFPSSVAATEELLGGITLQQFVESQISMLRGYLRDPKIEPMMPPRVGGADESMAMDVRHSTKDGRELVYRRIYARSGASVGVLTVTTLAADFPQVLQSLQPLLDGAAFHSTASH